MFVLCCCFCDCLFFVSLFLCVFVLCILCLFVWGLFLLIFVGGRMLFVSVFFPCVWLRACRGQN